MNNAAMSANRKKYDQYFSPPHVTRILLEYEPRINGIIGEPCAGDGAICAVLESYGHQVIASDYDPDLSSKHFDPITYGLDFLDEGEYKNFLHDELSAIQCCNDGPLKNRLDWIITNPPYSTSTATATQVFKEATKYAPKVAMLLRLGWVEACFDRLDFLPQLEYVMVIPRVQYRGSDGNGNSSPSIWCVWDEQKVDDPVEIKWADRHQCKEWKEEGWDFVTVKEIEKELMKEGAIEDIINS